MKLFRFLLFPFAILYDFVTKMRNYFFDIGFFKQTSFKIPVIVVGNLSVGGTGKTPQIEYLIRFLKQNYKIAVLSRGYKRKTEGFVLLNDDHNYLDVGDEPLQYYKKFKNIAVAVDTNRVEGITNLVRLKEPDLVLLDDAYQHRKVKGSYYILLTKYQDLFIDDFLLPTGNLRESKNGAFRANIILVTKCPENLSENKQKIIKQRLEKFKRPVFFTNISYADKTMGAVEIKTENLKDFDILLITGIANPIPFTNYLKEIGVRFKYLKFADHHNFSKEEVENIKNSFQQITSTKKIILTTEKDYMRLAGSLENLSYLPIKTNFLNNGKKDFNALLNSHLKEIL